MIRKQTWILLIIFALLLGVAFYLQKNPLPESAELTPSPTSAPNLLQGWQSSDIVWMELVVGQGEPIRILQDAQGNWVLESGESFPVEAGKAEQLRSEIAEIRPITVLPADYALDALGLNIPSRTLSIRDKQGKQVTISIGNMDPTESGYYAQVATQAPAVINSYTLEGIVDLFYSAQPTPTPEPTIPAVDPNAQPATPTPQ